eukprot:3539318-Pleurochrysis_carterae.AAC.1
MVTSPFGRRVGSPASPPVGTASLAGSLLLAPCPLAVPSVASGCGSRRLAGNGSAANALASSAT